MSRKARTDATPGKKAADVAAPEVLHVDARTGVGMFFMLTGTILAAFGVATRDNAAAYVRSLGIDANLWWGLALLLFGIAMLALGRRGQAREQRSGIREQKAKTK